MSAPIYNFGVADDGMERRYFALASDPNKIEYVCKALPGSSVAAAVWQIQKWTWVGNFLSVIEFADGDAGFNFVLNNRTSYF